MTWPRTTLATLFSATLALLVLVLVAQYALLRQGTSAAAAAAAERAESAALARIHDDLSAYLDRGNEALTALRARVAAGRCGLGPSLETQSCLVSVLLEDKELSEVTLTSAHGHVDEDGEVAVESSERWQVSAYRAPAEHGERRLCVRVTRGDGAGFSAREECREPKDILLMALPATLDGQANDPTESFSFTKPLSPEFLGKTIWSDLSYSQLDQALPEARRRVQLTALRGEAMLDGQLVVLKASLLADSIDRRLRAIRVAAPGDDDPYRVVLADGLGRLVSRPRASDVLEDDDDDLRVMHPAADPVLEAALAASAGEACGSGTFSVGGRGHHFLCKSAGEQFQGWRLLVVGPDDYYRRELDGALRTTVLAAAGLLAAVFLVTLFTLRRLRAALERIEDRARQMSAFRFEPSDPGSHFTDVEETLGSIELAKTAMRAMGRYVPVDLVRQLFVDQQEPRLGGQVKAVSMMFTDLEGFTSLAEGRAVEDVANQLGRYLEAMTRGIHAEHGIVDKFIGDAVMALWNSARTVEEHAVHACAAVLRCQDLTAALYASREWGGHPPLVTRYGVHTGEVLVGNFGAPDRFNFTAIGDGVNLAARLESLNKQYGTTVLVSEQTAALARERFAFRKVDRVAVKGKTTAVDIFELLGPVDAPRVGAQVVRVYEEALAAYCGGRFAEARALLASQLGDPPSARLHERCAELEARPPPPGWSGVRVAQEK
ncbi:MAG: adenylate/guanylate cyclase domain-containing protein [Myxococcaceae bacterium]|nr:adenylate/guanylate cyclase domain-containing protein [Myxococcaceae bacterium]